MELKNRQDFTVPTADLRLLSVAALTFTVLLASIHNVPDFHDACSYAHELSDAAQRVGLQALAIFGFAVIIQLKRIIHTWLSVGGETAFVTSCAATLISMIAFTTAAYSVFIEPHKQCRDPFGVVIHHVRYVEWVVSVPLLGYAAVMPIDGALSKPADIGVVGSLFLCICSSWMYQFQDTSFSFAALLLMLSCGAFFAAYYFMYQSYKSERVPNIGEGHETALARRDLKYELCMMLAVLLPFFPIIYFCAALDVIGPDATFIAYSVMDVLVKGLFAQTALDSQLTVLNRLGIEKKTLEAAAHRRHTFLKFLLHEVGVPLNTIVMGADCVYELLKDLNKSGGYNRKKIEAISLILDDTVLASSSIEDILKNCNLYQLIESKDFELETEEFSLPDMLSGIYSLARLQRKGMNLHIKIADNLPVVVVGNIQLLSLFVVYVILSCADRSQDTGVVAVEIRAGEAEAGEDTDRKIVVINVIDSGDRLSDENVSKMFSAFEQLDTGNTTDQEYYGTLRLAIGREILRLHGGRVQVVPKSEFSMGNVISIRIPFKVVDTSANLSPHIQDLVEFPNRDAKIKRLIRQKLIRDFSPRAPSSSAESVKGAESDSQSVLSGGSKSFQRMVSSSETSNTPSFRSGSSRSDERQCNDQSSLSATMQTMRALKNAEDSFEHLKTVEEGSDSKHSTTSGSTQDSAQIHLAHVKTLIVDDAPTNRKMLQRMLFNFNLNSDFACDGQEAVDAYVGSEEGYDLIFMDYTMPVMDGIEATRILREKGYQNSIVAVTANMMREDFQKFYDSGADLVISKPLKKGALQAVLFCFQSAESSAEARKLVASMQLPIEGEF